MDEIIPKIGKSLEEVINCKNGLFEIFVVHEQGYIPRRYLCTMTVTDCYLEIRLYNKFGRDVSFTTSYSLCIPKRILEIHLQSDEIKNDLCGIVFTLSRDKAYQYCMTCLRKKILEMRKKEMQIHKIIYTI